LDGLNTQTQKTSMVPQICFLIVYTLLKERIFDVVIDWQIQPTQTINLLHLLNNYEIQGWR